MRIAVVWANALDMHKSLTFLVIPRDWQGIVLLRVDTKAIYDVQTGIESLRTLPGVAFFDGESRQGINMRQVPPRGWVKVSLFSSALCN